MIRASCHSEQTCTHPIVVGLQRRNNVLNRALYEHAADEAEAFAIRISVKRALECAQHKPKSSKRPHCQNSSKVVFRLWKRN